ncbi:hypothetical protein BGZ51_009646 [Haplosporangium sp. Z 767]|nr:hypothetical protein BGZ51_009646 [Haplosporangium sp. Z 767]
MATTLSLFCIISGELTSNAFLVSVSSTDTIGGLKKLIKVKKTVEFKDVDANDLTLWRVTILIDEDAEDEVITLDALNDRMKLNHPRTRLSELFPERPDDNTYIIIEQPASAMTSNKRKWFFAEADGRAVRPRLETVHYDSRTASLVLNEQDFKGFPLNDKRSFEAVRADSRYAYFDRTRYISVLESFLESVLIFLRPRRFGKSLFLSTLAHFHGVENKQNYKALFQTLDVDRDVESGKVAPGQYLILAFDFSAVNRSPDVEVAEASLNSMLNSAIRAFYMTYATYLGTATSDQLIERRVSPSAVESLADCVNLVKHALDAVREGEDPLYGVKGIYLLADEYDAFSNEFLSPDDARPWDHLRTRTNSLLKGFWATVKSTLGPRSIAKCFITGVSPLSMADHTSGFNVATYVSWRQGLSGLCGLTEEDVLAALNQPGVCKSKDEISKHFDIMKINYNGYNFAELGEVPHVFNTNTCLEYLESLMRGASINPSAVSNSEVSESALQILAASPVASSIISDSLENQIGRSCDAQNYFIPYETLVQSFQLTSLASDIATSKSAWLSYMIHIGALTFCDNSKHLQIPNLVVAERFGETTLALLQSRLEDVDLAFRDIVSGGSIRQALALYKRTMEIRDVGESDFKKTEESHRDSFHYALLGNTHPSLRKIGLETQITKVAQQTFGRIDMLIQVPLKKRVILLEWKAIQIDFLDVGMSRGRREKAEHLSDMADANGILDLQFSWYDRWRPGQTIRSWITDGPIKGENKISPRQQLAEYVNSPEIALLKKENEVTVFLVVIIGSRQVLFWEMDNGDFRKDPELAS